MYREELKKLMDENSLSNAAISRSLGVSPAVLSQWLAGKYAGDNAGVEEKVKAFLSIQTERRRAPKRQLEFVQTSVSKRVFEVAKICHLDGEIGVVYGDAGLGKTHAVKEYARLNPDVILIEADLGHTARVLFEELHRKLGGDGRGTIHSMFEDCVNKLKASGRIVIVDEAEHLPYRALELLRRVYDKAGVGVLLCGMPKLVGNLRGKRGEYAQLYSRVGVAGRLESLRPADTEAIVTSVIPRANGLCKIYHEECHGNTRVLSKLIARSLRVAEINGVELSRDVITESARMLII